MLLYIHQQRKEAKMTKTIPSNEFARHTQDIFNMSIDDLKKMDVGDKMEKKERDKYTGLKIVQELKRYENGASLFMAHGADAIYYKTELN